MTGDTHAPESPAPQPIAGPRVVACVACGYDLRGLLASADCPECGTRAQHSIQGRPLALSGRRFRANTAQALAILPLTVLVAAGLLPIGAIGYLFMAVGGDLTPASVRHPLTTTLLVAVAAQIALASFALTTPERRPDRTVVRTSAHRLRVRTRALAVLTGLVGFAGAGATVLAATGTASSVFRDAIVVQDATADAIAAALLVLTGLLCVAAHAATLRYAATLADRLPDEDLAGRYRRLFWFPAKVLMGYGVAILLLPFVVLTDLILGIITLTYMTFVTLAVPTLLLLWLVYAAHLHNPLRRGIQSLDPTPGGAVPARPPTPSSA